DSLISRHYIHLNSSFAPSRIIPKWYHHVVTLTAVSPTSCRLKDTYRHKQLALRPSLVAFQAAPQDSLMTIDILARSMRHLYWCGSWYSASSSPTLGRVVKNSPTFVYIQHWIYATLTGHSSLTPTSQSVILTECPGCNLYDPLASNHDSRVDTCIADV